MKCKEELHVCQYFVHLDTRFNIIYNAYFGEDLLFCLYNLFTHFFQLYFIKKKYFICSNYFETCS